MLELIKSATFDRWLFGLRDAKAAGRIQIRLDRLSMGNIGDVKPVGGDKSTQSKDIRQAKAIAAQWED